MTNKNRKETSNTEGQVNPSTKEEPINSIYADVSVILGHVMSNGALQNEALESIQFNLLQVSSGIKQ